MSEDREIMATGQQPVNPYAKPTPDGLNVGTVETEGRRAEADVKAAAYIAHQCPRDLGVVFSEVMDACAEKDLAENATWAYPRGGKTLTGPSIRLAEVLALAMGNITYGYRELALYYDEKGAVKGTEMLAFAWDLQKNVRHERNWRNPHERNERGRVEKLTDPRDIREFNANIASRNIREVILSLIPSRIKKAAREQCANTLAGKADEPFSVRLNNMISKFKKLGISIENLQARLGTDRKLEDMLPEEYADFVAIYTSIKDGATKAGDWFNVKGSIETESSAAAAERFSKKPAAPKSEPEPTGNPDPISNTTKMRLILAYENKEGRKVEAKSITCTESEAQGELARLDGMTDYQQ